MGAEPKEPPMQRLCQTPRLLSRLTRNKLRGGIHAQASNQRIKISRLGTCLELRLGQLQLLLQTKTFGDGTVGWPAAVLFQVGNMASPQCDVHALFALQPGPVPIALHQVLPSE